LADSAIAVFLATVSASSAPSIVTEVFERAPNAFKVFYAEAVVSASNGAILTPLKDSTKVIFVFVIRSY
jgi:hypothetical protein